MSDGHYSGGSQPPRRGGTARTARHAMSALNAPLPAPADPAIAYDAPKNATVSPATRLAPKEYMSSRPRTAWRTYFTTIGLSRSLAPSSQARSRATRVTTRALR